jgi:RimJ/RimL family protein N-acetyltransferase
MDTMASLAKELPAFTVNYREDEWGQLGMVPWFSYTLNLPELPLPELSKRQHIKTERLIIRPILMSDLDSFHQLRQEKETQDQSTSRGRPDESKDQTRWYIDRMSEADQSHWYFGVFLQSTGELIGEGGLPDIVDMPKSGRPEAEFLLRSKYWRQGYGSEMFEAIMNSWWDLPRVRRRQQLLPALGMFRFSRINTLSHCG